MKSKFTERIRTRDANDFKGQRSHELLKEKKEKSYSIFESFMKNPETKDIVEDLEPSLNDPKKEKRALEGLTLINNQWNFFENLKQGGITEATITNYLGGTPRELTKIVRYTATNSNINDWMDVQAQSDPRGVIVYVTPVASKTKREGDQTAGDELPDALSQFFATSTAKLDLVLTTATYAATSEFGSGGGFAGSGLRAGTVKLVGIGKGANVGERITLANDDGNGNFIASEYITDPALTISAGAVDYATGAITGVQFDSPAAAIATYDVRAEFNWDEEQDVTEHAEIDLVVSTRNIDARFNPIGYRISAQANLLLEASIQQKASDILNSQIASTLITEKDRIGSEAIYKLSCYQPKLSFDTQNANAHSPKDHAQALLIAIANMKASMHLANNRGGLDFILAGATAEAYLNHLEKYNNDYTQRRVGGYKAGSLDGIPVYVVKEVPQNMLVGGWKGNDDGDAPLIYSPVAELATPTLTTKDFISQTAVGSYYAITPTKNADQYFRRLELTNLPTL